MRIVFCGFGRAGKECLLELLRNDEVNKSNLFVYTYDTKDNMEFINLIKSLNISFSYNNINRSICEVKDFNPNLLISVYYRNIISAEILQIVNYKAFNLHPSLLPKYKGCFSSVWALLNGEVETGITFHYIDNGVDTGRIILQEKVAINKDDTAYSLYHKLITRFVQNFNLAFGLVKKNYQGYLQSKHDGSYYSRDLPFDGMIEAKTCTYDFASRFIRAMYFPPYPYAKIKFSRDIIEFDCVKKLEDYTDEFI
ncbi:formyl transferase [Sporosarcina sp. PTS2304]|uniref:formyltransferase family protein n=1 Tax=Sporosarcina sp. PTS2304 TaxID=2283194 RepID=UPI000E0D6C23|nr:formyltransferase family protein [Sporosarcina sp. PTS2304]AXH98436.1 formyl transferase [Sporosarcina sp. PTS2304]